VEALSLLHHGVPNNPSRAGIPLTSHNGPGGKQEMFIAGIPLLGTWGILVSAVYGRNILSTKLLF